MLTHLHHGLAARHTLVHEHIAACEQLLRLRKHNVVERRYKAGLHRALRQSRRAAARNTERRERRETCADARCVPCTFVRRSPAILA